MMEVEEYKDKDKEWNKDKDNNTFADDTPMAYFHSVNLVPKTRYQYDLRLKMFFDFLSLEGDIEHQSQLFTTRANQDRRWAQNGLIRFIGQQKKRVEQGEMAASTVSNFYKPVKQFCTMNDISLSWKKITCTLPPGKKAADDRPPTVEEIKRIIKYGDRRVKPLVLTYISSGIRLGGWQYLRWKHIEKQEIGGKTVAGRITVYAKENEEYYTFCSREAYEALVEWMDYRESAGENITPESWVMRTKFQTTKVKHGAPFVLSPKRPLSEEAIQKLIGRAMISGGVRHALPPGVRRHEFKLDHGFRKFFQTKAEAKIKSLHVMMLMGQDTGLAASYNKPTSEELLQEYLKVEDDLTINKKGDGLGQKLEAQIESKDKDIQALKEQMAESERKREQSEKQMEEKMKQMFAVYFKALLEKEAAKAGKDVIVQYTPAQAE